MEISGNMPIPMSKTQFSIPPSHTRVCYLSKRQWTSGWALLLKFEFGSPSLLSPIIITIN